MSFIATQWGWFFDGNFTQLKIRVKDLTFTNFMSCLPDAFKGEISCRPSKAGQTVIVIQQMRNWTGWDAVKLALEKAKNMTIIHETNMKIGFGSVKTPAPIRFDGLDHVHLVSDDDLPF